METVLFFVTAYGSLIAIGLAVVWYASREETKKSVQIREEFIEKFT